MIAPARRAAFQVLGVVEAGRRDLGDAVDDGRQTLTDPRDVALLHELVVGTLRWQGRLDHAIGQLSRTPVERLDHEVRLTLRLAAYQLLFLTRVPPAAVVNDAVALVRQARKSSAAGLVNAVLRRLAAGDGRALPPRPDRPPAADRASRAGWVHHLAVVHAHPEWLVERWLSRSPLDEVEVWLGANNAAPVVAVRANPLAVASREAAVRALADDGVEAEPSPLTPWALRVQRGSAVSARAVVDGRCLVQDEGSQLAGHLAPVRPGDRVLDVCAAPGGKTLQYAAAAGAAGLVVAGDARMARVRLLARTVARGGAAARVRVVALDPAAALPFTRPFDVVVVDAPCSGLGTVRRDPDIKWRRRPDDLARYAAGQRDLLDRAARCVRPGGSLVYTTCSTEPEENDAVVAATLAAHPELRLSRGPTADALVGRFVGADGLFRTHPGRDGLDGYFGAVLERRADP